MDQKVLYMLAVFLSLFALGLSYDLVDIPFPCDRDSESDLMMKALDFVCIADKQDPIFEKFLKENGIKRDKRDSRLLNSLTSLGNQKIEKPIKKREFPEIRENVSHENNAINQTFLSNLKPFSTELSRRVKREDSLGGPNLLEKIYDCCEYSHRVKTSCTLRDLKPYCWDYIKNGRGS